MVDASIPNGTHQITTDTTETPKKSVMPPTSKPSEAPEECQTTQSPDEGLPSETEPSPQKVLKPPMPPSKEAETAAASAGDQLPDETSTDRSPEKKVAFLKHYSFCFTCTCVSVEAAEGRTAHNNGYI